MRIYHALVILIKPVVSVIRVETGDTLYNSFPAPTYSGLVGGDDPRCRVNSTAFLVPSTLDLCDQEEVSRITDVGDIAIFINTARLKCFEETVVNNFERAGALGVIHTNTATPGSFLNKINFGHTANEASIPFLDTGLDFYNFVASLESNATINVEIVGCQVDEHMKFCTDVILSISNGVLGLGYVLISTYALKMSAKIPTTIDALPRRFILRSTAACMIFSGISFFFGFGTPLSFAWAYRLTPIGAQGIFFAINGCLMLQIPLSTAAYWSFLESKIVILERNDLCWSWIRKGEKFFQRVELKICVLAFFMQLGVMLSLVLQPQMRFAVTSTVLFVVDILVLIILSISQARFTRRMTRLSTRKIHNQPSHLENENVKPAKSCFRHLIQMIHVMSFEEYLEIHNSDNFNQTSLTTIQLVFHLGHWLRVYVIFFVALGFGATIYLSQVSNIRDTNPEDFVIRSCFYTSPIWVIYFSKGIMTLAIINGLKGPEKIVTSQKKKEASAWMSSTVLKSKRLPQSI